MPIATTHRFEYSRSALAFDTSGNLYVANYSGNNTVSKLRAGQHHAHCHPHGAE